MTPTQALRERRAHFARETRALMDKHPVGSTTWGEAETKIYDANMAELDRIDAMLEREQRLLDKNAEKAFKTAGAEIERIGGGERKTSAEVRQLFNKFMSRGREGMAAEEFNQIRNTLSTTTTTEGGFTVATEIATDLVDTLKDYSGILNVAEIIRTAQGNPFNYPTSNGTAETGELIAENVTATAADPVFGSVQLNTFKYSSKVIAIPFELLQDTSIDMEPFLRKRLQQRLGRIINAHGTTGTGSGQPNGVVTASTVGKVGTTGQTLTIIYDDLVDVIDAVDIAYQSPGRCKWMFAQTLRKVIRKIKDTSGRPIWTPSYEAGLSTGYGDELLGYPIQINNDMPAPAANAKSLAFGDFSYYKVRVAMDVVVFRFTDSAYAKLGQVGFLGWMRAGGNLVDVAATRLYQHSAT
jgi:HK97 family phage major capsid protein